MRKLSFLKLLMKYEFYSELRDNNMPSDVLLSLSVSCLSVNELEIVVSFLNEEFIMTKYGWINGLLGSPVWVAIKNRQKEKLEVCAFSYGFLNIKAELF